MTGFYIDIKARLQAVPAQPKCFTDDAFEPVALDSLAKMARGGYSQPCEREFALAAFQNHPMSGRALRVVSDPLKLTPLAQTYRFWKAETHALVS